MKSTGNIKIIFRKAKALIIWIADSIIPKRDKTWLFIVGDCYLFSGNIKAFHDWLCEKQPVLVSILYGVNSDMRLVEDAHRGNMVKARSFRGIWRLLRSASIVVEQGAGEWYWARLATHRHLFLNLWHGIPIKRIGLTCGDIEKKSFSKAFGYFRYISSSPVDRAMMSLAFGVDYQSVLCTGYPRNDCLTTTAVLSEKQKEQEQVLLAILRGRRLVLYAPTFRGNHENTEESLKGVYAFSMDERRKLRSVLKEHNAVIGIRPHIGKTAYAGIAYDDEIVELSRDTIIDTLVLLRNSAVLISDYSGIWVDYLLLNRPIVSFAHDIASYNNQRGFLYDYEKIIPGPILKTGDELIDVLDDLLGGFEETMYREKRAFVRDIFHAYPMGGASERIWEILQTRGSEDL
ncbi:MAG: CDP-glycerol glycerophosphotransferase family protein [Kiritimatiellae bacterium]|nr:CDP-glycerol glycerophosphotransferase family protein [Kiritimatiellia bacterium]